MRLLVTMKNKPWLRWVGYPAFFQLAFLGGIYLTFPYEPLRDRIVAEVEKRGYDVEIDKVRLAGFSGVTLHGVVIADEGSDKGTRMEGPENPELEEGMIPEAIAPDRLELDKVTAKADLLAFLLGRRAVKFDVDAFGGGLQGKVELGEEEQLFVARARGIDFARSPLRKLSGLDLVGTIDDVKIDLRSPGADFSKADGTIEIKGDSLLLNGGMVQMFELPKIALGTLSGRIEFKEGVADFEDVSLKGDDLDARIGGTVRLQPVLGHSSITGKLRIKPSDDWWKRNEMLQAAANFALPAGNDGWRTLNIYGPISSPKFRPQK